MRWQNIFKEIYWFSEPGLLQGNSKLLVYIFFWTLVVVGLVIILHFRGQVQGALRFLLTRYTNLGITMGALGLILVFFRQNHVFFLGWRCWFLIWLVVFSIWLYRLLKYTFKRLPAIRAEHKQRELRERYLPKRR